MYNTTEIISKPVINLYNGNLEGTVKNICFDNGLKKAVSLILFNDSDEEESILSISKIYKIGKNAITIKNSEGLLPTLFASKVDYNNQINNTVFNLEGENLGKVTDIVLSDNYKVEKILIKVGTTIPSVVNTVKNFSHPEVSGLLNVSKALPNIRIAVAALKAKLADSTKRSLHYFWLPTESLIAVFAASCA